jgi:hypothetical protein
LKDEKNKDKEEEPDEDKIDFYDIYLEAIRLGLIPRSM